MKNALDVVEELCTNHEIIFNMAKRYVDTNKNANSEVSYRQGCIDCLNYIVRKMSKKVEE